MKKQEQILVYQMKVTLLDIDPPIWRRFQVTSDRSLHRLHLILQAIMGWDNYHLYDFRIDDVPYGEKFEEYEPGMRQSHRHRLGSVIHSVDQKIIYTYDFGDNWEHEITIEEIFPEDRDRIYPICLDGERAAPMEDCGGVTGYYRLLSILQDPKHEEHQDMIEWSHRDGRDYDPEECNLKSINRELRYHWPKIRRISSFYNLSTNFVNRSVAIIRPKEPFLHWLRTTPDWDLEFTLEELRSDSTSLLIPPFEDDEQAENFIKHVYNTIFEMELSGWYQDEAAWPEERNFDLFKEWFDVEINSEVVDFLDEEIEKEEF